jgi:hypothetical protein
MRDQDRRNRGASLPGGAAGRSSGVSEMSTLSLFAATTFML